MTGTGGIQGDPRAPEAEPSPEEGRAAKARIRVIWNPESGSKGGIPTNTADEGRLRELMSRAGLGDELMVAATPKEVSVHASDAARSRYDLVVAAGGDGTVGLVATQLLGSDTALAILPFGSVMNIARSLGLPREQEGAADVIRAGAARTIDVGEVHGEPFFETASVGMNAAMFRAAESFDRGDWTAILRTVWVAIRYRPARMSIALDDRRIRTRALMATVSNGPYTGAGMTVAPDARLDDGRLDVRVFRRFSKLRLLRHLVSIAFGRYRYAPEVDSYRSRTVRIESARPLPARADGHDLGTTPVELAVRPRALRVIVPSRPPEVSRPTTR